MCSRKPIPVLVVLCVIALASMFACYKGDPGYGNTDYPPKVVRDAAPDSD